MTSERELEALAAEVSRIIVKHTGYPEHHFDDAAIEIARRLQPARVPEGWGFQRVTEHTVIVTPPGGGSYGVTEKDALLYALCNAMLSAAPAPEAVITPEVAAHIKERIDALSPANNLSRFLDKPAPPPAEPGDGQREGVDLLTALVQEWRTRVPSDAPTSERVGMREYCADQLEAVIRRLASEQQTDSVDQDAGEFGERFIDGMGWVIPMRNVIKCVVFMVKGAQDGLSQINNLPAINPDIPKPDAPAPMNDEDA